MKLTSSQLFDALKTAGVLRDGESVRRVVIDCEAGELVKIYIERLADERLLSVVLGLDGVEIEGAS